MVINSSEFSLLPPPIRMYRLALAYVDAAGALSSQHKVAQIFAWENGSVTYFCIVHSIELFLKACILSSSADAELHHRIDKLQARYTQLFPQESFQLQTPWDLDIGKIEGLTEIHIPQGVHRNPDQAYRYSADKEGNAPATTYYYSPETVTALVLRLRADYLRIWSLIHEKGA